MNIINGIETDKVLAYLLTYDTDLAKFQHMVWVEELAELQKEVSKKFRHEGMIPNDGIEEEIADVLICITQMIQLYNIKMDDLQQIIIAKEMREYKRRMV